MFKYLTVPGFLTIVLLTIVVLLPTHTAAQDISSLGVANYLPVNGENIEDGYIISATGKGYTLSQSEYDSGVIGVVSPNPAIVITPDDTSKTYAVASTGTVLMQVIGTRPIAVGDLITASGTPGLGMKADKSGFIVGTAQEEFKPKNPTDRAKIKVTLNLRYAINGKTSSVALKSIKDVLSLSTIASIESPIEVFRYVLAGLIMLMATFAAIFTFAKNASLGIEALGRNPRAGQKIILGIIINVVTSVTIIGAGLAAAYFILAFTVAGL